MFLSPSHIRTLTAAVMLLFSTQTIAAKQESAPEVKIQSQTIQKKNRRTPEARLAEQERLIAANDRAWKIFTLLGGEMALQKGDAGMALGTYMHMLDRTKSPDVAERALEMAVSLNAFEQAELIYQKWREIEPVPGAAQKRMTWLRDLLLGKNDKHLSGLDEVLTGATEEQNRRIFLLLAQTAVQQPDLAEKASAQVHKETLKYPEMPEAAIADAIYSAYDGKKKNAIAALQRLAKLDSEILPPTMLTLRLMAQRSPEILNGFFEQTDTRKLSSVWQELEITNLVANHRPDKAYSRLKTLLEDNPSPDLFIQAAILSSSRKDDLSVVNHYLEKAYQSGTSQQQSRAALIGAMTYADAKDYVKAKQWLGKINSADYIFDKTVLSASLEAEQGNGKAAWELAQRALKLPEQQGRFFGARELQRVSLFAIAKHDNPKKALSELNTLMAKASKQPDANQLLPDILYQRAMVYDKIGERDKAIADLRRQLEISPDSTSGMNALGYIMLSSPKYDLNEAFKLIQAAYQVEPENPAVNDSLGWAYYLKGDTETALPYLQYAFEQYPDAEVASHLGEVLWKLGKQEDAKAVWTEGLKQEGDIGLLKKTMRRFNIPVPPRKNTLPLKQNKNRSSENFSDDPSPAQDLS